MNRTRALALAALLGAVACRPGPGPSSPPAPGAPAADYRLSPLVTIATGEHEPFAIAADDAHVYWGAGSDLRRAPLAGGPAETFAAAIGPIEAVAVDATHAYVLTSGDSYAAPLGSGRLVAIAKADGAQAVLATGLVNPGDVKLDGDEVFFTHSLTSMEFDEETGQVLVVARSGGTPRVLADKQPTPHRLALDATHVYFTNYGGQTSLNRVPRAGGPVEVLARELGTPTGLALAGGHVYVTAMFGPSLWRVPQAGGEPVGIAAGSSGAAVITAGPDVIVRTEAGAILAVPVAGGPLRALAFDRARAFEPLALAGDALYFTNLDDGSIKRVALGGGLLVLAGIDDTAAGVALDGDTVYFVDTDNGVHGDVVTTPRADFLMRVPLDASAPAELVWATGPDEELTDLAVDADFIYVTDRGHHRTMRVDKRTRAVTPGDVAVPAGQVPAGLGLPGEVGGVASRGRDLVFSSKSYQLVLRLTK